MDQKVIVISGGSDGLGYQIAKQLTPKNTVVILSPSEEKASKVAKELGCDFVACDVSDYNQVETTINKVVSKHKSIDCVVNNAGIWIQGGLEENEPENIKRTIEVNTLGTIYLTKAVIAQMKQQKKGLIINVISQAGLYGKEERSVYTASKFAITGFTKSMQPELAKYGIRVTGLYPGKLKTKMFEKVGITKEMNDALDTKEVARTIEFILSCDDTTVFSEIGIKHIDG